MKVIQVSKSINLGEGLDILRDPIYKKSRMFYKFKKKKIVVYREYENEDEALGLLPDGDSKQLGLKKYSKKGGK